tara:strand:- start:6054 stop:6692 length:639 start_codon:yes stop_codon:yes gene_type:complete
MSNLTSGSTEYFPIISNASKPNRLFRHAIIGESNSVSSSAQDIVVNGVGNFIGDECRNINLLNTSACIVSSGVISANLFSCSGLTIDVNDVIYIKNVLITEDSFGGGGGGITSGVTFSQAYRATTPTDLPEATVSLSDYTVEYFGTGSETSFLSPAAGQTQIFNIKNSKTIEVLNIYPDGSDTIEGASIITLNSTGDTVTLQSNGTNNYIIL